VLAKSDWIPAPHAKLTAGTLLERCKKGMALAKKWSPPDPMKQINMKDQASYDKDALEAPYQGSGGRLLSQALHGPACTLCAHIAWAEPFASRLRHNMLRNLFVLVLA
jgi:hypothetical protein